jgi:Peptidase family M28
VLRVTSTSTAATDLAGLLDAVSAERLGVSVAQLAGAAFAGRRVGSAGGAAARAWLGQQLTGLGAAVTMETFPVRSVPEVYAAATVSWSEGQPAQHLVFGRQVVPHLVSADVPMQRRAPLGVAGESGAAGRWLLVPAGMSVFDAHGAGDGAAGLVVARAVEATGWHYTQLAGSDPGPLPVLTVDPETHARLTRAAATGSAWLSADAPIRRLDVTATNIHARLRYPTAGPDLLLTAHYDGVGDLPGLRQPGAGDNGSGVAVVLEAARLLAAGLPAGAGLSVALLDGEEVGALGSAHHAEQLVDLGATPLVVNVDGAAALDGAAAVEAGGPAHALLAILDQAGRTVGLPLTAGPVASDNRRYGAAGIAAVGIGAGLPGYHSPADTPERVQPHTMTAITRLVLATCWLAAAGTV